MSIEVRPMREDDRFAAFNIARTAFGQPLLSETDAAGLPVADRLVAVDGDRVVGMLRLLLWDQFFGGAPVSAAGIAAVAVAQSDRGRGIGGALLEGAISELSRRGVGLATLNFSGMGPYRKAGFEIAGSRYTRVAPVRSLPTATSGVVAVPPDDPAIKGCYRAFMSRSNGMVDRPDWLWEMLLSSADQLTAFAVLGEHGLRGYIIYASEPDGNAHLPFEYAPGDGEVARRLAARDLIWLDGDAAADLLGTIAAERAVATDFLWPSGADDPLPMLFPDIAPRVAQATLWMARLIDVPAAFQARGFPASIATEFNVTVRGQTRERTYALRIADGGCTVDETDGADAVIEIGPLSAIFTGWLSPRDAVRIGALRGALDTQVADLEQAFAGPSPWMADHF